MENSSFVYKFFAENKDRNLLLTQYGYHKWTPTTKHTETLKGSYVLHVVISGKGYYRIRDKKIELSANKAFLLRPTEIHEYASYKDDCLEYIWIGFDGAGVADFLKTSGFNSNNYVLDIKDVQPLSDILQEMLSHTINDTPDYFLIGRMYEFLDVFLKQLNVSQERKILSSTSNCSDITAYLKENYQKELSISKICQELGIERSGLFKKFKKEYGIGPQSYIIQYRLNLAENMITQTKMLYTEIAEACGFNSYPYFCKKFKAKYGKSPSEYRRAKNSDEKKKP